MPKALIKELRRCVGLVKSMHRLKLLLGITAYTAAVPRSGFQRHYDLMVTGDVDLATHELLRNNYQSSRVSPTMTHIDYRLINKLEMLGLYRVFSLMVSWCLLG
ncbi:hypothetical protein [Vulcanisaeta distributa]|uniref:Uncharacterized protein n=1 Tax=Vulcanisaeta distributa (strain DSM 14429 / JCM 11212 / NBRC 100878 / IC-017) TaxID=572478 RepID=E1QV64_VULDI|nr:hypothetical protein [Vulcanisaeta distributa]ADN51255.1 hypothetical protein Vdis_1883 [Vulcanisaeta distributa DSM 14429]